MDQCNEGLAVPVVRAGLQRGAALLLHGEGRRAGRAGEEAPGTGSGSGWGRGGDSGRAGARAANGERGGGGSDQWGRRRRWEQPMGRRCGEMERRGRAALLLLAAGGAAGGSGRGTRPGTPGSSGAAHRPAPEPCSVLAARCRVPLPRRSRPCPAGTRSGPDPGAQPSRRARGGATFPGPCAPRRAPRFVPVARGALPPHLAGSLPPGRCFPEPDRLFRFRSGHPTSQHELFYCVVLKFS